ncbi:small nuclear ribonucleoprotein family protein [Artemisia annua]|uniref:U6 snRNA-associated Sm-like protein LSm8 n=1 Tax=Artemisia annua TaxID=35608 RepID=A0A2U1P3Q5_ARTAN|nr:small nuclear ribonucleoprotein family protein [Artemisia annua]
MLGGPGLESVVDQIISVITNDGRNIVGLLKGFDQATNIILDESHERVYSTKEGVQQLVLGLYIIRGDNIVFTKLFLSLALSEVLSEN